ncbi:MAG: AsmA family protein [Bradyrhizobium sp.]|uniref:AsmA family protein n=1 Tax=Bradyrhizobium sp. TaxID=376 RepID=UPI0025BD075E|nr:AsmA family protein [Bradyrhizobium sp.]MBI5265586.1 AsmA family protein [Bradyrhizobium sp.]
MKAIKIAGAAVASVVIVLALLMVIGIPSGFVTSAIQSRVERDTGYRVTIAGTTRVSLWPSLNLTLNNLTLEDPKDRTGINRVVIDSLQADMSLSSAWSGHPQVSQLVVTHPVIYLPLLRERLPNANPPKLGPAIDASPVSIDRVKIRDGSLAFSPTRDRVESRIDAINADAVIGPDRKLAFTGTARAGESAIKFDIKAAPPTSPIDRANVPVEFAIDMPGTLPRLSGKAEVRLNGPIVMFNGVSGMLGDGAFNGWASVDIASKPLVKLDLDFQRLDIAVAKSEAASASQPWSDAPINVSGLNYVDAQTRISAVEAHIGDAHFAPAAIDARLAGGIVKASVSNLGAYGGQISSEVILDATSGSPSFAMHSDLVGVRALPLLTSLAHFDRLDGKLQAKLALRSVGGSQRALMSNLQGTVFADFQDGAIRGINVAQMIRSLTTSTLSGWQDSKELSTDLSRLSASFRVDKGQAVTTDLNLVGPLVKVTGAGTIDLGTKLIAFRVEPKLVLTTEGQGRTSDPVGFGIPVIIDGSWSQPRIYPEMSGIFDNPDAAYAKLREMGKGLFGPNGAGLNDLLGGLGLSGNASGSGAGSGNQPSQPSTSGGLGGSLGETLGNLIQQGLNSGAPGRSRSMPTTPGTPPPQAAPSAPAQSDPPPVAQDSQPDSQPMNDVLRQLFNR